MAQFMCALYIMFPLSSHYVIVHIFYDFIFYLSAQPNYMDDINFMQV